MTPTPPGFFAATRLFIGMLRQRARARSRAATKITGNPAAVFVFILLGTAVMYWAISNSDRTLTLVAGQAQVDEWLSTEAVDVAPELIDAGIDEPRKTPDALALTSLLLAFWWLSLALQSSEGAIDGLRRRNPIWEWYASFPVARSAAFIAECLAPAIGNTNLLAAPVLLATLAGTHTGSLVAGIFALPIGVPLVVAAIVWNKAIEVCVMLRATPRNRGTWLVTFAILAYVLLFGPLFLANAGKATWAAIEFARPILRYLPSAATLLETDSLAGWLRAFAVSIVLACLLVAPAFAVLRFAVARGLESGFGREHAVSGRNAFAAPSPGRRWFDDPLWRKERLWLERDRSAWLQMLLFPLMVVGMVGIAFWMPSGAGHLSWNQSAGLVAGIGGYLLFAAAPRALASEVVAIGIAVSWPRPLQQVLRVRIHVLLILAGGMATLGFGAILWKFPQNAIGLAAVAAGWFVFAAAGAEKSIAVVRAVRAAGDIEPLGLLRVLMHGLGNFAFAIGVYHAQWDLAVAAIVLNWVMAAALWQDFRHREPYLFDPHSEPPQTPPTVLGSVLAVVGLLEISAIVAVPLILAHGVEEAAYARSAGYGFAAVCVFAMVAVSLARRGLRLPRLLVLDEGAAIVPALACVAAALAGGALALLERGYLIALSLLPLPTLHEQLRLISEPASGSSNATFYMAVIAVGFAPWIEEFLFRGLLFRSMLDGLGAKRAVLVSSALFAILHFWAFWPMIFAVGAASAFIYYRSRALVPCIVLHAVYNALVIVMQ